MLPTNPLGIAQSNSLEKLRHVLMPRILLGWVGVSTNTPVGIYCVSLIKAWRRGRFYFAYCGPTESLHSQWLGVACIVRRTLCNPITHPIAETERPIFLELIDPGGSCNRNLQTPLCPALALAKFHRDQWQIWQVRSTRAWNKESEKGQEARTRIATQWVSLKKNTIFRPPPVVRNAEELEMESASAPSRLWY